MKAVLKFLILLLPVLISCGRNPSGQEMVKDDLMQIDREFCRMSAEKGRNAAFLFYADENAISMRDGDIPFFNKKELENFMKGVSDKSIRLHWEPIRADVSGDLGFTFGQWDLHFTDRDTVMYGTYVTVWKRQKDGSWKYVLDGGNNMPRPIPMR